MVNYSNVLTETSEVLNYFDKSLLEKIPNKLINKIRENINPQYNFTYNKNKKLDEQEIMKETKDLISAIYLMYCCDKEERQKLMDICKENEKKHIEKLSQGVEVKDLVIDENKERTIQDNVITNNLPQKKETQPWYHIVYDKIRNFINKILKRT